MTKKNILYAFIVVSVIYFFSALLQLNSLEVLSKPFFLPILLLYYLKKSKEEYQFRVVISFIFYYIAEMLVLKDSEQYYILSVSLFLIPYLILLYYIIKDLFSLMKIQDRNRFNIFIALILAFLFYLYLSILFLIDIETIFEKLLLYAYGFVLLLLGVISIAMYVIKNSVTNLFLLMTVIAFIISDMFYILIVKVEVNYAFKSINLLSQLLSYYFFITYSLIRLKEK